MRGSQIASGVIRGDISAACNMMLLSMIGDKARTTWSRTLEGIVWRRGRIMLVGVDVGMSGIELGRVANATDLGWCSHWRRSREERGEREGRLRAKI